jgi:hypothetical protein
MSPSNEMFPDCRNPFPCLLRVELHEPCDLELTTILIVQVYDDRRNCLASSNTRWIGSEHDYLPLAISAVYGMWATEENPKALVALVEEHYKDARKLAKEPLRR